MGAKWISICRHYIADAAQGSPALCALGYCRVRGRTMAALQHDQMSRRPAAIDDFSLLLVVIFRLAKLS